MLPCIKILACTNRNLWGYRPTPHFGGLSVSLASRFYARIVRAFGGIACRIVRPPEPPSAAAYSQAKNLNFVPAGDPKGCRGRSESPLHRGVGTKSPHKKYSPPLQGRGWGQGSANSDL